MIQLCFHIVFNKQNEQMIQLTKLIQKLPACLPSIHYHKRVLWEPRHNLLKKTQVMVFSKVNYAFTRDVFR